MTEHLEQLDRRAFLRGLTLTSAGLFVPRSAMVAVLPLAVPTQVIMQRGGSEAVIHYKLHNGVEHIEPMTVHKAVDLVNYLNRQNSTVLLTRLIGRTDNVFDKFTFLHGVEYVKGAKDGHG